MLLIWDLKRPERFYYLFTRGNHRSWLVLGGYCLLAFGVAALAWFAVGILGVDGLEKWLAWPVFVAAAMVAGYTAFLFGQAEGRDLWQSGWLFPHLLAQALMTGAGVMAILLAASGAADDPVVLAAAVLVVGAVLHLAITAVDLGGHHDSPRAAVAARTVLRGRYQRLFLLGAVTPTALAVLLAAVTWAGGPAWLAALAGLIVQPALLAYETAYVRAGQDVPLS